MTIFIVIIYNVLILLHIHFASEFQKTESSGNLINHGVVPSKFNLNDGTPSVFCVDRIYSNYHNETAPRLCQMSDIKY